LPEAPPAEENLPMAGIFISYRRDDASGHAGRLFDRLAARFGRDRVFMDVTDIAPGEDFTRVRDEKPRVVGGSTHFDTSEGSVSARSWRRR
jgi:hypothetical protein